MHHIRCNSQIGIESVKMMERIDIILFGVTGFTGKHTLDYLHKFASAKDLTWGVAGRNKTKIVSILAALEQKTGDTRISSVPIIIADVSDDQSIQNMVWKARLIINCCGPYRFIGETVVKACVEAGTHHIDVSGELYYMEKMELDYHKDAEEKNIYIVSACGFNSIPCDMGVLFLQKNFKGTLNSIESFLKFGSDSKSESGSAINNGSWESVVNGLAYAKDLTPIRSKLFANKLPKMKPLLHSSLIPFRNPVGDGWAVLFPGADRSVVLRTQRHLYVHNKLRPVQVQTYFIIQKFWSLILLTLFGALFYIMTQIECGRRLLLKYPRIFSAGFVDTQEPSEEMINKSWFSITLIGKGWREKFSEPDEQFKEPPNKGIMVEVKGTNPGYGATCICLVLAGIVILTETSKMPGKGGVLTPGAAFRNTSLLDQLHENGETFNLIKEFDV
ncbi:hypothetical protein WA026_011538 [Henosepilachna vigintioctopunctata]|uniref:Saccharopine dehydrogenase NADP binding domain-containing protein n=1 Tax=Henosepilachna vigintioctopunctata TaxID=420089 RepID=A0AAW1TM38_9CUCU